LIIKVSELIEQLKKYPEDMNVIFSYKDNEYNSWEYVVPSVDGPMVLKKYDYADNVYSDGQISAFDKPLPYQDETVLVIS